MVLYEPAEPSDQVGSGGAGAAGKIEGLECDAVKPLNSLPKHWPVAWYGRTLTMGWRFGRRSQSTGKWYIVNLLNPSERRWVGRDESEAQNEAMVEEAARLAGELRALVRS